MRRILTGAVFVLIIGAFVVVAVAASSGSGDPTYRLEFDNAFGLVNGAQFKVAGVPAGSISSIDLCFRDRAHTARTPSTRWSQCR